MHYFTLIGQYVAIVVIIIVAVVIVKKVIKAKRTSKDISGI